MTKLDKPIQNISESELVPLYIPKVPSHVRIFGKLEISQPTGSIKDRAAKRMLSDLLTGNGKVLSMSLEEKGLHYGGQRILDSSSGNYGVALSYYAKEFGLDAVLVVPGNTPSSLIQMMRNNGVNPILTDPSEGYQGALRHVSDLARNKDMLHLNQYANLGNLRAHFDGTAKEIWKQTKKKVTDFVVGVGTGGTLIGSAMFLKQKSDMVRVHSVHPESDFPGIQGLQPLTNGTIHSRIYEKYKERLVDSELFVSTDEAAKYWDILRKQGISVGLSSGANIAGIIKLIEKEKRTSGFFVTVLPDSIDRYEDML